MKKEMTLFNGVKVEFTEDGVNVVSSDGQLIQFDENGKLLCKVINHRVTKLMEDFDFMGMEEQRIAKEWAESVEPRDKEEAVFVALVKEAGNLITEEYWIANIEPSIDKAGKLYYKKGNKVASGISCIEWKQKAREFAPEYDSDLASQYQLVLWYAYRIAKGCWTIGYVCGNSSSAGNYWNSPNSGHGTETSGARTVGGARDGVGNTSKIVTGGEVSFVMFGGDAGDEGGIFPVAYFDKDISIHGPRYGSSGVLVLGKLTY